MERADTAAAPRHRKDVELLRILATAAVLAYALFTGGVLAANGDTPVNTAAHDYHDPGRH